MNRTFLLKMMSLTFIGLLILFNSCESSKKVFNEQKTFDPSGKPLSFKGLRLGMTRAEILESGNDNNFNWTLSDDNILKYNKSDAWIGYEGEEEDKIYYYFHKYVGVTWCEDKIMEFGIKTPIVNSETENDEIKIY